METVILVIHLMVVLALIVVVLLQRSEGGGLGMGGGGFMSSRGTANALTRTTAILAGIFFLTSIILAVLATQARGPRSILDRPGSVTAPVAPGEPAAPSGNALDQLKSLSPPPQPSGSQPPQPANR